MHPTRPRDTPRDTIYIAVVAASVLTLVLAVLEVYIRAIGLSGVSAWEVQTGVGFGTLVVVVTTTVALVRSHRLLRQPPQPPSP